MKASSAATGSSAAECPDDSTKSTADREPLPPHSSGSETLEAHQQLPPDAYFQPNCHLRSSSGAAVSSIPWVIATMPTTARTAERLEYGSYTAGPRQMPLGGSAQFGRGQSTQFSRPAQFSGPSQPRANTPLTVSTTRPHVGRRSADQLSSVTAAATTRPTTACAQLLPVGITKRPKHTHSFFRRLGNRYGASGSDHP